MNEALSTNVRYVTATVVGTMVVSLSGCSPSYSIVANPTEPWEDEIARERQAARESESNSSQATVGRQRYDTAGDVEKKPEHSAVVVALTDIIAFPFRGAGWLAQRIF